MSSSHLLVTAVSWLSLANALTKALALVTMPLLTHWLSPESYGEAALVNTVVSLLSVFALAGIDMSYARHYFSGAIGSPDRVESFCWRWTLGMSLLLGVLGAAAWAYGLSRWFGANPSLYGFVGFGIAASALSAMAQTRRRLLGGYARIAYSQLLSGLVTVAVTLGVAYWWRRDAWPLLLAMIVGYSLPLIFLGAPSLKRLTNPSGLSQQAAGKLVRVGLAGVLTAPAYWVVSSSDRWFLARYFDSHVVGVYSIGYTVGTVGMIVTTAITAAWLPELSRAEASPGVEDASARKGQLSELLLALLLIVWLAVVAAGSDLILLLADAHFHAGAAVVPWLAAGVLFYGAMHVGNTHLILIGKLHWSAWAWLVGLILSIAFNFWLVPRYGIVGAAITQAITLLATMTLVWIALLRFERIAIRWGQLAILTLVFGMSGVEFHRSWDDSPLVSLTYKFPVGVILAAVSIWLLFPQLFRRFVQQAFTRRWA